MALGLEWKHVWEHWAPAIITGLVGAGIIAWVGPKFQNHFATESQFQNKRIQLVEQIGADFTDYILARQRLIQAAKTERAERQNGRLVTADFKARKANYVSERDAASLRMSRDFVIAELYFTDQTIKVIEQYRDYSTLFTNATIDQLPASADYIAFRDSILVSMTSEIGNWEGMKDGN